MALWLELIPKIHRSDQLDRRFHLLDDFDNATTFERYGTRELLPLDEPFIDDDQYFTTTSAPTTTSTSVFTTARTLMSSAVRRVPPESARRTSTPQRPLATTPRHSNAVTASGLAVVELAAANVPLSVTVSGMVPVRSYVYTAFSELCLVANVPLSVTVTPRRRMCAFLYLWCVMSMVAGTERHGGCRLHSVASQRRRLYRSLSSETSRAAQTRRCRGPLPVT